jgi:hypothetical protein
MSRSLVLPALALVAVTLLAGLGKLEPAAVVTFVTGLLMEKPDLGGSA